MAIIAETWPSNSHMAGLVAIDAMGSELQGALLLERAGPLETLLTTARRVSAGDPQHRASRPDVPPAIGPWPERLILWSRILAPLVLALITAVPAMTASADQFPTWRLEARIVAVGLPGVAGVRQVGRFHSGGPIPRNPEFLLSTGTGRVLDPERVMVAVASNFGAPLADATDAPAAILSIDPRGDPAGATLVVPESFAASGKQSQAAGGAIQLYTAQAPAFRNSRYNAGARTAGYTAATGPRYLSINNAFGRPWIANAPKGLRGAGTVTVVDPDGAPLNNAPSTKAGGVFAGSLTNRAWVPKAQPSGWIAKALNYRASDQLTRGGLTRGALGTAFLGPSPDGTGFAVFAVATGDGAVAQAHVQDGVDGLAEPGTIGIGSSGDDPGVIGIAFKWNPERVLYLADAARDRLVLLHLEDDRQHFTLARTSVIALSALKQPVDIAAAQPEIANPHFASHTTLAGGSDLYVANRGDGSLVRIDQDGRLIARAEIELPGLGVLGRNRIRAMTVSADAQRLWLTIEGELPGFEGHAGALIEVSAFDEHGTFHRAPSHADAVVNASLAHVGSRVFQQEFTPETGLGPLFNENSCVACHPGPGGASVSEEHFVRRVARMDPVTGRVVPIDHPNSPVARRYSTRELGEHDALPAALPRQANVSSLRMPLPLYVSGDLDEIPDSVIEAQAVSKGDGIKGRAHIVVGADGEQRVGRYGWKAHIATLDEMVGEAFVNEIGVSSALAPQPHRGSRPIEDDGSLVRAVATYLRTLRAPSGELP